MSRRAEIQQLRQQLAQEREERRRLVGALNAWPTLRRITVWLHELADLQTPLHSSSVHSLVGGRSAETPQPSDGVRQYLAEEHRLLENLDVEVDYSRNRVDKLPMDQIRTHRRKRRPHPRCGNCDEVIGLRWTYCARCGTQL